MDKTNEGEIMNVMNREAEAKDVSGKDKNAGKKKKPVLNRYLIFMVVLTGFEPVSPP
jgi:hypothetical protein